MTVGPLLQLNKKRCVCALFLTPKTSLNGGGGGDGTTNGGRPLHRWPFGPEAELLLSQDVTGNCGARPVARQGTEGARQLSGGEMCKNLLNQW